MDLSGESPYLSPMTHHLRHSSQIDVLPWHPCWRTAPNVDLIHCHSHLPVDKRRCSGGNMLRTACQREHLYLGRCVRRSEIRTVCRVSLTQRRGSRLLTLSNLSAIRIIVGWWVATAWMTFVAVTCQVGPLFTVETFPRSDLVLWTILRI